MSDAPRLLCVYQHAPTVGAPGIYRHRLYFAELVRRGWTVDLVSTPINYMTGVVPAAYARRMYVEETIDGIAHHWVWASAGIHASKARRVANYASFALTAGVRAATLSTPDVVLASSPPLTTGALGPLLAARFRRPWVLEVRDAWPESAASVGWLSERSVVYRALERLAHRITSSAAAAIVPTPGLVEVVRGHGAREIEVVPGPVLDSAPEPARRTEIRSELGVDERTRLFVYVGAVGVANGLDLLLDAVDRLPPELDARFVIVGDGSARASLAERVAQSQSRRVMLIGAVAKQRVPGFLAAADVCLHMLRPDPIFETALPSKVLEYFGAHRPFLTTVRGVPQELAFESGGGFANTADALAAEILRWSALSSDELLQYGERAYAYGSARFGLEASVDRLESVLARVASMSAGAT